MSAAPAYKVDLFPDGMVVLPMKKYEELKETNHTLYADLNKETRRRLDAEKALDEFREQVSADAQAIRDAAVALTAFRLDEDAKVAIDEIKRRCSPYVPEVRP